MESTDLDRERSERERKQTYLKYEIVNKGYNKIEFATFMNAQKENGMDIDLWMFDELVEAVTSFQQCQQQNLESSDHNSSDDDELYAYIHPAEREKLKRREVISLATNFIILSTCIYLKFYRLILNRNLKMLKLITKQKVTKSLI